MSTRYTRCQSATKKGNGPQCSNSCHRWSPNVPNLMDRCATHHKAFIQYQGADIVTDINNTPFAGADGQTTPGGTATRAPDAATANPIHVRAGPGQQPPIMQDARMRPRRHKVTFALTPQWEMDDSEEEDESVAPTPDYGPQRREPSPRPQRQGNSRASPAPARASPAPNSPFNRPEVSTTPRKNAPRECDASTSEFEYLLSKQDFQNLGLIVGTDLAQSLRQLLRQVQRPKQQVHYLKDHPPPGERPNSQIQIYSHVLAIMLERQATTDAVILQLGNVLASVFGRVAELAEDYRERRSRSRSVDSRRARSPASRSRSPATRSQSPAARAHSPAPSPYYESVEEDEGAVSSGEGVDEWLDRFAKQL